MSGASRAILATALLIAACVQPADRSTTSQPNAQATTPAPTTTPGPSAAEAQVWDRVRAALPGAPIIAPTWLPASVDRNAVELIAVGSDRSDPRYTVRYRAVNGWIDFALGPAPQVGRGESGLGSIRVRGSPATVAWPQALSVDRTTSSALRRIRWEEGPRVLQISSERFTGDELLRVAWGLDQTGAPLPAVQRAKPGACAGANAEATVLKLISLIGSGDRDAVIDCWARDWIADAAAPGAWADLPRARDAKIMQVSDFAGRWLVQATWRFERDPGGAWNPAPVNFFLMSRDEGPWRAHSAWTAGLAPLP